VFIFKKLTGFNQFIDAFIDCFSSLEAKCIDFFIGNAVISFVLVLADVGKVKVIVDSFLDFEGDIFFAAIVLIVADIEYLMLHFIEIFYGKKDAQANIMDMDESPFISFFEENEKFIDIGLIDEIIDEEVEAHTRGNAEGCCETETQ